MFDEVVGGGYLPREGEARACAGEPHLHDLVATLVWPSSATFDILASQWLFSCREAWSRVGMRPECFAALLLCVCHQDDAVG